MLPSSRVFRLSLMGLGWVYLALIVGLIVANIYYVAGEVPGKERDFDLFSPDLVRATWLTLVTSTVSASISTLIAVPTAYALSRFSGRTSRLLETVFDIPILLPPLVVGFCLLLLFNQLPFGGRSIDEWLGTPVTFSVAAIILAQVTIGTALAIRSMRASFDELDPRAEQVAQTLGCSPFQAFRKVALPSVKRGVVGAASIAWARSMGEFGPIVVFAGTFRGKTEVLSTSVYIEIGAGRLESAAIVALLQMTLAMAVLIVVRFCLTMEKEGF
ncbi:MAG: ABC transporter permease subunit [Verrucomicrobiales bacterium]|nr:ABC transporter permease subunit [Verrucomicrobiales bacterium]